MFTPSVTWPGKGRKAAERFRKVGLATEESDPSTYRSDLTFGKQLWWHLFVNGTRPAGSPGRAGEIWVRARFAGAIGTHVRTVGYWFKNQTAPSNIAPIEKALFGDNPAYEDWRRDLRRALRDVERGLVGEQTLVGHDISLKKYFVGVPPRESAFVGRASVLERLHATLALETNTAENVPSRRAAVHGLGGVGKTALVVEYVNRFRDSYAGIWWCPAETREGLLRSLSRLAALLGAVDADEPDIEFAANQALRTLDQQSDPWLLIYDNAIEPDEVNAFFPASSTRVIITSRFSDWTDWADPIALNVLTVAEAAALLNNVAARQDDIGAAHLADILGWLPLALNHAAVTCRRTSMSFVAYSAKAEKLIIIAPRATHYPKSVFVTFTLAITDAASRTPAADRLMSFLAQCSPDRIPLQLTDGISRNEVEDVEALLTLTEYSLVQHDLFEDGTPAITVHRLVQNVARARSEKMGTALSALTSLVVQLSKGFPQDASTDPITWPDCEHLISHVLALFLRQESHFPNVECMFNVLRASGAYLERRARFAMARILMEGALRFAENTFGADDWGVGLMLADLAFLAKAQGRYAEASTYLQRSGTIAAKTLGFNHPETAKVICAMGNLSLVQADYETAETLFNEARSIVAEALGQDHPAMLPMITGLAAASKAKHNIKEAVVLYQNVLSLTEAEFGSDDQRTAAALNNLGSAFLNAGNPSKAQQLAERALGIREKLLGEEHPETADSLHVLAHALAYQDHNERANKCFRRALDIREKVLGPDHPHTARTLSDFGAFLGIIGKREDGLMLIERAIRIQMKVFGPKHRDTTESVSQLNDLWSRRGETPS